MQETDNVLGGLVFQTKQKVAFLATVTMLFISIASFPIHASGPFGETYSFSESASRIQETNSPGITFVLNVTTPVPGFNYQFSWVVIDPRGAIQTATTTVNSAPSTFTASATYPTDFGIDITYVGVYNITVSQSSPPPTTQAATSLFQVGLTDAEEYQRTQPRSEEHTSELQSHSDLVCRLLLEKKKKT